MEEEKDKNNIQKEFEECARLKDEYLAGWKRERADFINFKKDESERIQRAIRSSEAEILKVFLPVIDNIHLLEKHIPKAADECWVKGFENTKAQITKFLEKAGVKEIECLNKEFDPNIHEAIEIVNGDFEVPTVVEEAQKGYIMNEKVIRPAKVKVANKITK